MTKKTKNQQKISQQSIDEGAMRDPVTSEDVSPRSGKEVDYKKKYVTAQMLMEAATAKLIEAKQGLSGSEAVFGFCGWLTTREIQTVMSSRDDAAIIANLVKEFCSVNHLSDPRDNWEDNLIHPEVNDDE